MRSPKPLWETLQPPCKTAHMGKFFLLGEAGSDISTITDPDPAYHYYFFVSWDVYPFKEYMRKRKMSSRLQMASIPFNLGPHIEDVDEVFATFFRSLPAVKFGTVSTWEKFEAHGDY